LTFPGLTGRWSLPDADADAIDAFAPEEALAETIGTAAAEAAASAAVAASALRRHLGGCELAVDLRKRAIRAIRPGGLGLITWLISFSHTLRLEAPVCEPVGLGLVSIA